MKELIDSLKQSLANTFVLYFKAHSCHWNVEGVNFPQYHGFFGSLYEEVHGAIDPLAENIRKLNIYAPASLMELYKHNAVEEGYGSSLSDMLNSLYVANNVVLVSLNKTLELATQQNKQGLANFLADRIDQHEKHKWMLTASLKGM